MTEEEEIVEKLESLKRIMAEHIMNDFEKQKKENPGSELLMKMMGTTDATIAEQIIKSEETRLGAALLWLFDVEKRIRTMEAHK